MLVFTRRAKEEIIIQGNIRVQVLAIGANRARIGISAPPSVQVNRQEIHERMERKKRLSRADTIGSNPEDEELEGRVVNFLARLNRPIFDDLKVAVCGGRAVIAGRVDTYYQKQLVTNCCQRVAGVTRVVNEIHVGDELPSD